MKGILINTKEKTFKEIDLVKGHFELEQMYRLIGCQMVETVQIDDNNDVWVDEEGLLNVNQDSTFFKMKGYNQPICGNGIVLGMDNNSGECTDTTTTIEWLKSNVTFHDIVEVSLGLF